MNTLTLTPEMKRRLQRLEQGNKPVLNLYYRGMDIAEIADKPFVAIIGTRKPTPYGTAQTTKLAEGLARAGVVVVSGLALGVDALAHQSALSMGGYCVAVIPTDVNHIYPATNRPLAEKIISGGKGAVVSEQESYLRPHKVDFLIRNRIVAALSDAVIVTEANARSGTLNTARQAREMGIPVYAIPGNVTSPSSAGCNWLIQQGAKLLSSVDELLVDLNIAQGSQQSLKLTESTPEEALVLQAISKGDSFTDQLVAVTGLSLDELQTILTMLEIDSRITQNTSGNWELL